MPTELEQYLYDHQFDFELGSYDSERGCLECEENDYPHMGAYGLDVAGHERDCVLAAMLARAGFAVAYHAVAQGCPTQAFAERETRLAAVFRDALARGLPAPLAYQAGAIDQLLGDTVRIAQVMDVPFSVYRSNDVPLHTGLDAEKP